MNIHVNNILLLRDFLFNKLLLGHAKLAKGFSKKKLISNNWVTDEAKRLIFIEKRRRFIRRRSQRRN